MEHLSQILDLEFLGEEIDKPAVSIEKQKDEKKLSQVKRSTS